MFPNVVLDIKIGHPVPVNNKIDETHFNIKYWGTKVGRGSIYFASIAESALMHESLNATMPKKNDKANLIACLAHPTTRQTDCMHV